MKDYQEDLDLTEDFYKHEDRKGCFYILLFGAVLFISMMLLMLFI